MKVIAGSGGRASREKARRGGGGRSTTEVVGDAAHVFGPDVSGPTKGATARSTEEVPRGAGREGTGTPARGGRRPKKDNESETLPDGCAGILMNS